MTKEKIKKAMSAAKQGFTIMETLLAASIFTVTATIATTVFVRTMQAQSRTEILNAMYEDGRVIMEQLTNEIQNSAVDYEEYYSINLLQIGLDDVPGSDGLTTHQRESAYGLYYGAYASGFYDPGYTFSAWPIVNRGTNPKDLGIECSHEIPNPTPPPNTICDLFYTDSKDLNTGQNPWDADGSVIRQSDANAICDDTGSPGCHSGPPFTTYQDGSRIVSDELYLLSENNEGTKKTIFAQMLLSNNDELKEHIATECSSIIEGDPLDCGIGKLKLRGRDLDNNGVIDYFTCDNNYPCRGLTEVIEGIGNPGSFYYENYYGSEYLAEINKEESPTISLLQDHLKEFNFVTSRSFVPITPFRTSIKSIRFIISPPEDPYKGFAEQEMQVQPYVTIIMEIQPSYTERMRYRGYNAGTLKLQRTVTAGITKDINSYPSTNDVSWICWRLGGGDCGQPGN